MCSTGKKHQHTFGDSAGDRSGFITDLSKVVMGNIEELNEEDYRKYTELREYIQQ
jgi:hydroxymethylpyrimidine pyrophosphatase-like HAD family hydrolase